MKNISSHYRILRNVCLLPLCMLAAAIPLLSHAAPTGSLFTYQGRLNTSGAPATDGVYDFRFTLHDASEAGSAIGSAVLVNALGVTNGLFTATLDFGSTPFTSGAACWLQLQVNTNGIAPLVTLNPRQRITPTPQAIYAENAGMASAVAAGAVTSAGIAPSAIDSESIQNGSIEATDLSPSLFNETFWKLGGNVGAGSFLGTLDNQPLDLRVNNQPALRLLPNGTSPNVIGGYSGNSVNLEAHGAFIGGGGSAGTRNHVDNHYATVGGGRRNTASGEGSFVGGGTSNLNSGYVAVVGGGAGNTAGGSHTTISGGLSNQSYAAFGAIAGGVYNFLTTSATASTIGGGQENVVVQSIWSTIGGGRFNQIRNIDGLATIGGGELNVIQSSGYSGTIGGGGFNLLTSGYATIGGGFNNTAQGSFSAIAGGNENVISGNFGFIGGGWSNAAAGPSSTVSGGFKNRAAGSSSTIGGGNGHEANADYTTVAGGWDNVAATFGSTIGGGVLNNVNGTEPGYSIVAGGLLNTVANSQSGTISGGKNNFIADRSSNSFVGGGSYNSVDLVSPSSTIAGGSSNRIRGASFATVSGGYSNSVTGDFATVPGGSLNAASGDYAQAAGRRAKANHNGSFVWADDTDADFASTTNKQFAVRANNGVMIQSSTTALDLRGGGGVRVAGAGVNTATPIFTHQATAANTSGSATFITHPHCIGKPNAILIVTYNYNPAGLPGIRNDRPVGIYYNGSRWGIYNLDATAMPIGAAYNVLVANP